MQQVLAQRSLANLEFVGASVRGSGEQSVRIVLGRSDLESIQRQRENVELAQVT